MITIFIGSISGGGAERVACNLANYIVEKNEKVCLLTMSETQNSYGLQKDISNVVLLRESERKNKFIDNFKRYVRLREYIKHNSTNRYIVFLPVTTCLLLHFANSIKGEIIASERNDPKRYSKIQQKLLQHYAKRADKWVFQTEEASEWYGNLTKEKILIPNAINPEFVQNVKRINNLKREKIILAAGRLNKQKNYYMMLDAFEKVSEKYPEYKLQIYGKGPLESELKKYLETKLCKNQIEFCGYVNNMPEQLEKAEIYVLTSDYEGMPNSLIEAMAIGLPCISTDCPCGGPRFLIKNYQNGILVPVADTKSFSSAIIEVIENGELREKLGNNAKKIIYELDPEKIYAKWAEYIYKKV